MTFYWSHWWPLTLSWCPTYLAENKRLEIKSPPFKIAQIKMLYLLLKFSFFLSFEFKVSISLKISSLNIEVPIDRSSCPINLWLMVATFPGRGISRQKCWVCPFSRIEKSNHFFDRKSSFVRSLCKSDFFFISCSRMKTDLFSSFVELKLESEVKIEALAEMSFHYLLLLLLLLVLWETIFWLKIYCQTDVRCSRRWKEEE